MVYKRTQRVTVGVDEVGRGCWAGPLVAGAVILRWPIKGLKDSKQLTKRQRETLSQQIQTEAQAYGIGWVSAVEVDTLGLVRAVAVAMERAVAQISSHFEELIIDGNYNFLSHDPRARTLIKADALIPSVSAASIIAKVARDAYMSQIAPDYPGYGFEQHVGYGTAAHRAALQQYGVTDQHRRTYKPVYALLS